MTTTPSPPTDPARAGSTPTGEGKVALVTGGAKRVGRAVALSLAETGYDVAITYRTSEEEARQTVADIEALGRRALAIQVDLGDPDAAAHVLSQFASTFDRLDALVNNASVFEPSEPGQVTLESFDRQMAVNARGPLLLTQVFTPMLADGAHVNEPSTLGRVVNFVDIHVLGQPLTGYMAYNMSKAALLEATKTAAMELAPLITINAIAPGVVGWAESYTERMKLNYMTRVPLARAGTPDDAAAAVLFLVRDAHYCTGQVIRVDGGRLWT